MCKLHVLLHVPQHVAVVEPLRVVRHAKLQRPGWCAGCGVGRRGLKLEAVLLEILADVGPQRGDVAGAALGRRVDRHPELEVEEPPAQFVAALLPVRAVQPVPRVGDLVELLARDAPDGRVGRVQHLPPVRDLQRRVQLHRRQ
ncbi:hypothetical protein PF008_g29110 [Phytophthora fragariae]|uniref:Uncharacterized protein n=1 Tax=Phytophthora fragariae TaxID=53985 RepID=A0A6G0Q9C5_9STRA|nr:hypothetical protein PF008_g29110 [Phytophthora fragariae]